MTVLEDSKRLLADNPDGRKPTGWTIPRHLWLQLLADPEAGRGPVRFGPDPYRPTLAGLPVTVSREADVDKLQLETVPR